jgi:hypothetical protein
MTKRCLALALSAFALCAFAGCDGKPAPKAEPSHGLPPLDPHAAPTVAMPRDVHPPTDPTPSGAAMPPGHPHVAPNDNPHGGEAALEQMTPGDIAFDKATVIAGTLKLDAKLKDKVKTGDTIFIVVRAEGTGGAPGQVLAVQRVEAKTFPMPFQIDSRDAMVAGTQMKAPVVLSVRVDKDGDAMSKNPGDVTGTVTIGALPAPRLTLNLDKVL